MLDGPFAISKPGMWFSVYLAETQEHTWSKFSKADMPRSPEQKARIVELTLAHPKAPLVECDTCGWIGVDLDQRNPSIDPNLDREVVDPDTPLTMEVNSDYIYPGAVIPSGNCPRCYIDYEDYNNVFPINAPIPVDEATRSILPLGKLTKEQAVEILQGLEMRAHFYTVKGTTHQTDIEDVYDLLRVTFNAAFGMDIPKLQITGHVVIIRPPQRGI